MNRELPRTLFILGRVSNLPTLWSNCLAAWILTSGLRPGNSASSQLLLLTTGCSVLYLSGMYLNDAFDVSFDQLHRPERPIPSGKISRLSVSILGTLWLVGGLILLVPISGKWAWILAGCILLYNAIHKKFFSSVFIMAGCRALIYPMVGAGSFLFPKIIWIAAGCMALWVLILSLLARTQSRFSWTVPNLLAAIPLLDLVIIRPHSFLEALPFFLFTILALVLRRNIPPT